MTSPPASAAKPRLEPLTLEALDRDQARVAEKIAKYSGGIGGPFNMLLRDPVLAEHCFDLGSHLLFSTLPRPLVEMAVLMRARYSNSDLEWWAHRRRGLADGLAEDIIDALEQGRRPAAMTEEQTVVYEYCAELLVKDRVSDRVFDRAREMFGEKRLAGLTGLVGFYGMVAMFLKAAEVGAPDPDAPKLSPIPNIFPVE